jgi:branched-chain amino acid transport system substrate-binding protein
LILLTEIAAQKPMRCTRSSPAEALRVPQGLRRRGLKDKIPLVGPGFSPMACSAAGSDARGQRQRPYADALNTKRDNQFRLAYAKTYKLQPDVYAVQGYDTGPLLAAGLKAVKRRARARSSRPWRK